MKIDFVENPRYDLLACRCSEEGIAIIAFLRLYLHQSVPQGPLRLITREVATWQGQDA